LNRINLLLFLILTLCFAWTISNLRFGPFNIGVGEVIAKENKIHINSQGIEFTIIYDNYLFKPGLKTSWGFSCVVQGTEKTILFDTGGNGSILLNNMEKLEIDPQEIDLIVLSHIHGDHVGGLDDFLEQNAEVDVYLPQSFPHHLKEKVRHYGAKIIEVQESTKIIENTYSTGVLGRGIKEQALIVQTEKGVIVITGCAHPGIVDIVKKAKNLLKEDVLLVMGGFHLMGQSQGSIERIISEFIDLGVRFVGPCHCSGDLTRQLFQKEYAENYINIGVGKVIDYNELSE
jgi:7,8-dihydropterin-6-yl-methyl-4-(beta-D-ribofuranosyl)aminobenzene 5'-phosphate synthase